MPTVQQKIERGERVETRDVPSGLPRDPESYGYLRWLVSEYYAIQAHRIRAGNRAFGLERDAGLSPAVEEKIREWLGARLSKNEAEIKAAVQSQVNEHPLWSEWLKEVRGVGPCIAGGVIAYVSGEHFCAADGRTANPCGEKVTRTLKVESRIPGEPDIEITGDYFRTVGIATWPSVSKFWTYCGYGLDANGLIQRRRAGVRGNWSPAMKQIAWKAGESFVRSGDGYRALYEQAKARIVAKAPEDIALSEPDERLLGRLLSDPVGEHKAGSMITLARLKALRTLALTPSASVRVGLRPAHADARARRWTVKVFLAHLWQRWREIEGLPVSDPYVIDVLGHKTLIPIVER